MAHTNLSRLMRISWVIQRSKNGTRSKALQQAWAILLNEDIAIQHLTRKLNHHRPVANKIVNQYVLFNTPNQ